MHRKLITHDIADNYNLDNTYRHPYIPQTCGDPRGTMFNQIHMETIKMCDARILPYYTTCEMTGVAARTVHDYPSGAPDVTTICLQVHMASALFIYL